MKLLSTLLLLVLVGCCGGCGMEVVDTGHRGVKVKWGEVVGESLPEGLYFYNPFTTDITELNVQTDKRTEDMQTYTQDVQQADLRVTLNYNLEPASAHLIYRDVGTDWADKLIPQVVAGALKETIGKWTAENLVGNRDKAAAAAYDAIKAQLAEKHIVVTGFEVNDVSYTDAFERSVEDKVVAIQKAIEEKNRTVQIEEQAKQTITSAQAEAKSIQIRADALANSPKLVEWERVKMMKEKWDGKMPGIITGDSGLLLNVTQ